MFIGKVAQLGKVWLRPGEVEDLSRQVEFSAKRERHAHQGTFTLFHYYYVTPSPGACFGARHHRNGRPVLDCIARHSRF